MGFQSDYMRQTFLPSASADKAKGNLGIKGQWIFYIELAGLTAADVITAWTPGFAGTINKVEFVSKVAVTTGAKAADLNLEIGTTNLTGGVVGLTSANCTPKGVVVAGTAVTAANTFTATDTISVEAANVTTFVEGDGWLIVSYTQGT